MPAKLFISHNSTAAGLAARVRDKMISLLEGRSFQKYPSPHRDEILIDVEIRKGDYWRPRLYEWLEEADLGLILCCAFRLGESADAEDMADFRRIKDWLFHEATVLAHRRHVNKLRDLQVLVIGIDWKEHPFAKMDAMNLGAIQHAIIFDEADQALSTIADSLRQAANNIQVSTQSGPKSWFDAVHSNLKTYLTQFGDSQHGKLIFAEALYELGVFPPDLPAGYFFKPNERHCAALAWRLVQGPLVPPENWPPLGPQVPYWQRHLYQLRQLLHHGGRIEEIDIDLPCNLTSTWVGLRLATDIGHEIAAGTRIFHIHAEIAPEDDFDTDIRELTKAEEELLRTRRPLLNDLIFAASWIWSGDHDKKPNIFHVSRVCKLSRKRSIPRKLLVETERTDMINDVLRRVRSCKRTGLPEEPVVVIDDTGVFYQHGYLNHEHLHRFRTVATTTKVDGVSPTLLFICSAGLPPSDAPPEDCRRIIIPEEAWRAAFGLQQEVGSYLGRSKSGTA
jgi:hypothetical protein